MMFKILITALTLAFSIAGALGSGYTVRVWQSEDGLPGNVLRSIVQSADGYLWIASAEGIARFDGIEFLTLPIPETIRLPRGGPSRLFSTPDNHVWFSSPKTGLLRIRARQVEAVIEGINTPRVEGFTQVIQVAGKDIVARRGEEIWLVSATPPRLLESPSPEIQQALAEDLAKRSVQGRILPNGNIAPLIEKNGRRWTSDTEGISVSAPDGSPIPLDFADIGPTIIATEFLEDIEGNIWAVSPLSGLLRFRNHRAEIIDESNGLTERSVNTVIEDHRHRLWFGNRSGGVDVLENGQVKHFEIPQQTSGLRRPVSALYLDRQNQLWIAARDGSVFLLDDSGFHVPFPDHEDPSKVDAIYQDHENNYWFGGARGLVRWDGRTVKTLTSEQGAPSNPISAMKGDANGHLWLGTNTGQVFREKDQRIIPIGSDGELGRHAISDLLVQDDQHAWAATLGTGLHFWDGKKWHRFDRQQGLPDSRLTCILADDHDSLWLGSLGGIIRVSKEELIARTLDASAPIHWLRIDRSDGLPTSECAGYARPSGWRSHDGFLYFPTGRGVIKIDPAAIEINPTPPPVFLREITANGQPLTPPSSGPIEIGPGRTRLEFAYHGLAFGAPEKTTYRTRLAGLDPTWREVSNQRISTFEAVPPGRYQFEVIAINGDGIWSEPKTIADLIIQPNFWETPWFVLLSISSGITLAAATGWLIARNRMKRRIQTLKLTQALENERSRISRDLHDELGASLTELSIFSALAVENPDDSVLRPSLNLVTQKAKTVVSALDEIVWAATPSEDSLRSLIEYLAAFSHELLHNVQLPLRTEIVRHVPDIPIGPNRRHNVFLTVREALNNAIKHSKATEIRLQIAFEVNQLVIRIIDDGRGFPHDQPPSGFGLNNLKSRMKACGGTCEIDSERGKGTIVSIRLPLPS